ncbi:tetratricopeptide repeat protein [Prochlorococcus sp. MIT 0916]|uniref:TPR repeat n=1 Tax=Prochlorococcus marinus str. P0903-H212 TaxID=1622208 RepID=A0A0D5A344_PROMR|nr:TPR repeat [Prochlorococcus marinus str. P0903-H212]
MEANIEIAQSLFKQNKYQETIDTCQKILATDSNSIEAIKLIAKSFLATRKIDNARLYFDKALTLRPDDYEAIKDLGNTYKAVGDINNAKKYYQKAIAINESYAPALTNAGLIELNTGNKEDALSLLIKASEAAPQSAPAWVNLANGYFQVGKTKEAETCYRKAIELNPQFFNSHLLLGTILVGQKKLQEAEISFKKAIELKPDFFQAHLNLGAVLKDLEQLQEAEISTRKAIELNPQLFQSHFLLGTILVGQKKLQKAEISFKKAIELKPDFFQAHLNLGAVLKDLKQLQEAFDCYVKAIELNPKYSRIYPYITRFLRDSNPSQLNKSKLKNILNLLLEKNNIAHNELFQAFSFVCRDEIISNLKKIESEFSKIKLLNHDKLLINALKKIIFKDIILEKSLTKIRKKLCDRISQNQEIFGHSELQFITALGEQCFLNEYVYSVSENERLSINTIIKRCINGEINETNISILSCYLPLYKLLDEIPSLKFFNSSMENFNELIKLQILEPLNEIKLSKCIKRLGSINDKISQKVKAQYEENPYPRWRYGSTSKDQKLSINQVINNEIQPNSIRSDLEDQKSKILIAGCGTGQQILQSQRYKNAQVTAIDISLSSLSYAQRKINELRINNVELIQMDILEISLLEQQFDIIECGGVLHHMNDPLKGLKKLLGVLNHNGLLGLGLYSELARQDVARARKYIANQKIQPDVKDIKSFREDVFSGKIEQISNLRSWGDFHTISECRDLCFHAKEHRFTIKQLQEIFESNELNFLGFRISQQVKSLYKNYFPEDKTQTNLQNWAKFEEKHPYTFRAMYQFWVSKGK